MAAALVIIIRSQTDCVTLISIGASCSHQGWTGGPSAGSLLLQTIRRLNRPRPAGPTLASFIFRTEPTTCLLSSLKHVATSPESATSSR